MAKRIFKPAPAFHSPHLGPASCMCVPCCRIVLDSRCEAVDPDGYRCGDYKRHRGDHTLLPCTAFMCAEERVRLDGES